MKEMIGTGVGQHKEQTNINGNEYVMSGRNGVTDLHFFSLYFLLLPY